MEDSSKKAYNEVNKILSYIEQDYIDRIPNRLLEVLKNEEVEGYEPEIQIDKPLTEQNLQQKTFDLLAMLHLNYWCDSEEEKKELLQIYAENDRIKVAELRAKYNPDNIFKEKDIKDFKQTNENNDIYNQGNNMSLISRKEQNFIKRILLKIKNIFKQ